MRLRCLLPALALLLTLTACGRAQRPGPTPVPAAPTPAASALPTPDPAADRPTVPRDVAEGIGYLYDFRFSERYDGRVSGDFSLTLPEGASTGDNPLALYGRYRNELSQVTGTLYSGDGMVPYNPKTYQYVFGPGRLTLGTHAYEPDHLEFIAYLWSDIPGAAAGRGVAVGSTEGELLEAYTENLYYVNREEAEPGWMEPIGDFDFDCAYVWQPFTPETNDIRDVAFYLRDGKVAAVELISPYELRYVYGYDRDAGLRYAGERRSAGIP